MSTEISLEPVKGPRTLGVTQILSKKYKTLEISEEWKKVVGVLPDPFSMIVVGQPKNGKTSFIMRLCRHLAERYKVFYSSLEEGDSKTIQDALILAKMEEVTGNFFLGDGYFFNELVAKLKQKNSPKIIVIDSHDYMKLTIYQWQKLEKMFPRKSWIIICWGKASAKDFAVPDDYFAKKIKYKVGTVVLVRDFIAESRGRYGPTEPYTIWDKRKPKQGDQLKLEIQS